MTNLLKREKPKGLYVLGTMYPDATGGMEIFNYYFLKYQLNDLRKDGFYWTTNNLQGFENDHLKVRRIRPISIFYPLQLFVSFLKHGHRISYVYMSYARTPWVLPFFYAIIFRLFNKPYFVTIHSGGTPVWKPAFTYRYFFKNAKALVGVSRSICQEYSSHLSGKKIHFIPPLIPFEHAKKTKDQLKAGFGLSADCKVLLYVGSLKGMKNPDKVLKAFSLLKEMGKLDAGLKLVLVGGGEMMDELKSFANENKLSTNVYFSGLVKRELIPDFFGMADYYIISSDYEGTSISLLEAMFNKLPIIGADSPGITEILQANQNALLYSAHNIERLADCILKITTDLLIANRLAEKANKDFVEKYSYTIMIEKYEELFNNRLL
jgi:glycosyltransferase involved in cell wall biosynthesis